jgi:trigger factor
VSWVIVTGRSAPADVTVTVTDVRERQLPELDDEFAQLASQFDTADELRTDTRERLTRVTRQRQLAQARDEVLTAYLAGVDLPLPERTVDHEVTHRKDAVLQEIQRFGMSRGEYLRRIEKDEDAWDAEIRESSQRALTSDWVLDALAEERQISVAEDEITQVIAGRAMESGIAPEAYAQELMEPGRVASLVRDVARGKALAELVRSAHVTDSDGNAVDVEALEAAIAGGTQTTEAGATAE